MILVRNLRGYGGNYTISISGEIKDKKGMTVPQSKGKSGHLFVNLKKEGKDLTKRVDKLVLHNYHDNPKKKKEAIHLDSNKSNTLSANLRWATDAELKAFKPIVLTKKGNIASGTGKRSATGVIVTDTHSNKETPYNSPAEAASALGLTPQKVRKALRGKVNGKNKISNYSFSYA